MDQNTVILTLEYSYVLESQSDRDKIIFQSSRESASLWRDHRSEYGQRSSFIKHLINSGASMIDNIQPLRAVIAKLNDENVGFVDLHEPKMSNELLTVVIKGGADFIEYARSKVLKTYNYVVSKEIPLSNLDYHQLLQNLDVQSVFIKTLNSIATNFDIEYLITCQKIDFHKTGPSLVRKNWSDDSMLSKEAKSFNLYLLGNQDNITAAETQVRVLINSILSGFYVDSFPVDLSMIPLLGGIDLMNFAQIAKQSDCNIYVPDLLPELFNSNILQSNRQMDVYITSREISSILLAKYHIETLCDKLKMKQNDQNNDNYLITKKIPVFKTKLDLILLLDQAQILNIMFKYGVFVQLPSLGSESCYYIEIQGQSVDAVEQAVYDIALLCSNYQQIGIKFDSLSIANSEPFESLLCSLATNEEKSSVISCNKTGIEVFGTTQQIKQIIMLLDTNFLRHYSGYFEINLVLEINNVHKEFISGKKNGKMMKVLNQLNQIPVIEFLPFNEYNFLMNFIVSNEDENHSQNPNSTVSIFLDGLELIGMELPAELKFNIPEVFHKSIIGNGGSIIQSIMKKYNVFIKFTSNNCENSVVCNKDEGKIFYTFQRFNNVLIKCPQKNAQNIPLVKYEIDELVRQCCSSNIIGHSFHPNSASTTYLTTHFKILKSQFLLFTTTFDLRQLNYIEAETNTFIDFPKSIEEFEDQDSLTFMIKGTDNKSKQAAEKLTELLPKTYRINLAQNPGKFEDFLSKQSIEFKSKISNTFRMILGVEVTTIQEGSTPIESPKYHSVLISYYENTNSLQTAINDLVSYIRDKNFLILDKNHYNYDNITDTPRRHTNDTQNATNFASVTPLTSALTLSSSTSTTKKLKSITNTAPVSANHQGWKSKRKSRRNFKSNREIEVGK